MMKYERPQAEVIEFDNVDIVVASGLGPNDQALAEAEALTHQEVLDAMARVGGNCHAVVDSSQSTYNPVTRHWTITVNIVNNGGKVKEVVVVVV